ncbi:uncharacterized protein LOC9321758 [Arabidopsis lyrata subsp. lyrata]|uniref:uncharacterized protein LOC9321758 n=1 Tax=Arabidopsis lyrata subsp. lyrata TaxID=81972 RepID=UPI000A29C58E|nr:uncharacterized protein LOC9321758 [Arabidopsis lyrata subsp. lyrata]|eukprot:XP_020887730.1 uncharacterized protein LOC9321758 [Arabidopsis lyrata subsp. lyrata]
MAELELPSRLFADREEPAGDRVNMYFKLNTIKAVLKALTPEELDTIRPEFGLVTGLNCQPLPALDRALTKCPPGVTPYWFTLFGGEECFTGEMLLGKLRRPKALSSEVRVKYACLLLVDGFLCRRSFHMKIPKEHVEMIRDLDVFLKYPWGRYSFDMTMQCIKSRSLNQLAQATVAIQGFIHALCLVLVEAVPAVLSAVGEITNPESGDEDVFPVISLKLDKVWDLDKDSKVDVFSIIPAPHDVVGLEDCSWADEVRDPGVEVILSKIEEGCEFNRGMFVGGLRGAVLHVEAPPRVVNKGKRKVRSRHSGEHLVRGGSSRDKKLKVRSGKGKHVLSDPNTSLLGALRNEIEAGLKDARGDVYAHVCVDLKEMELRLERSMKRSIFSAVAEALSSMEIVKSVVTEVGVGTSDPYSQPPANGASNPVNPAKVASILVNPADGASSPVNPAATANLNGESEEAEDSSSASEDSTKSQASGGTIDGEGGSVPEAAFESDGTPSSEKFKKLVELLEPRFDFEYGGGIVLKESELRLVASSIPPDNPQVMDACVSVMRESVFINTDPAGVPRADMLTSHFHGSLAVMFSKFKKCRRKESFEFDEDLLSSITHRFSSTGRKWLEAIDYLYSPFNIDKNRWIAVMVDLPSHSLSVFDSTANALRGSRLKPELEFLCEMFPYLVRKIGANDLMINYPLSPLSFTRHTRVTQASDRANTGMLSLLFMEAHAFGGFDKVCQVSEAGLRQRAEQLAVQLYEHCCGDIEV